MPKKKIIPAFDADGMNKSVNPGDDFEEFANGGWKRANPVPDDESRWGTFDVLNRENEEVKIGGIIDKLLAGKEPEVGSDEQKIIDMYRSYMDIETVERLGLSPIQDLLDEVSEVSSMQEWVDLHARLIMSGVEFPVGGYVGADDKDSSKNSVFWAQDGLTLGDRSYYDNQDKKSLELRKELTLHIDQMFKLANIKSTKPGERILDFEMRLAKINKTRAEMRDPLKTYNPLALYKIGKINAEVNWVRFAEESGLKDEFVIVHDPKYLRNLSALIGEVSLETLTDYSTWQIIKAYANLLPKEFEMENFRFFGTLVNGVEKQKTRAKRAVIITQRIGDGMVMGRLYAKEYFPESSKQKVAEMIENIRNVFQNRINGLDWMSEVTKEKAQKKLADFSYKIGYPDQWIDTSKIQVRPNALIKNARSINEWKHNFYLSKIGKKVDKTEWGMSPQTINAYYRPTSNEIVFPAGILQPPFFNPDADDAVNYGGIMAVIGHEFSHGFDDKGSEYDGEGNLNKWWTEKDRKEFDKLGIKLSKYFSQFEPIEGARINGDLTLGENIGDLGGITLSYYALEKSIQKNGDPGEIDGLTWKQRYFLSWAKIWCENLTDERLRNAIKTDPHSPDRFRIMGPLPHFDPFYEAFDVKPGDAMYIEPSKRIAIW